MKVGRYKAAAVVLDGKLYVAGGYNTETHEFLDTVEVFDDVSQQWYSASNLLNGGRAGHKMEAVGGK
jgi:N-acetylneuraminic acid mutarotase